ncbi:MAG: glycosyltransferase family 2 protein [Armatimonadetes bacterium]|nr:glycosyltransferase family 2 protein [Armatimonadota bacterium]
MASPRVSIIVPSYNHARYIPACVQGVLAQTFQDWELIVVDDGSTDGSVDLWRSFDDPRIQVHVNERNLGTYPTENRAVELSQGDLIAVLNDDDIWEPGKLEKQFALLDQHPDVTYCYTLGWFADEEGNLDQTQDPHKDWPTAELQDVLPNLLEENNILASSVMFRREHAYFEPTLKYCGDWYALLQGAARGPVCCAPERLSHWRIHEGAAHFKKRGVYLEDLRIREAIFEHTDLWLSGGRDRATIQMHMGRHGLHLAALYALFGLKAKAVRAAWTAVRHDRDRRAALRRFAACLLPLPLARKKLWPEFPEGLPTAEVLAQAPVRFRGDVTEGAADNVGHPSPSSQAH